jgi:hypothetical protein
MLDDFIAVSKYLTETGTANILGGAIHDSAEKQD